MTVNSSPDKGDRIGNNALGDGGPSTDNFPAGMTRCSSLDIRQLIKVFGTDEIVDWGGRSML